MDPIDVFQCCDWSVRLAVYVCVANVYVCVCLYVCVCV